MPLKSLHMDMRQNALVSIMNQAVSRARGHVLIRSVAGTADVVHFKRCSLYRLALVGSFSLVRLLTVAVVVVVVVVVVVLDVVVVDAVVSVVAAFDRHYCVLACSACFVAVVVHVVAVLGLVHVVG